MGSNKLGICLLAGREYFLSPANHLPIAGGNIVEVLRVIEKNFQRWDYQAVQELEQMCRTSDQLREHVSQADKADRRLLALKPKNKIL